MSYPCCPHRNASGECRIMNAPVVILGIIPLHRWVVLLFVKISVLESQIAVRQSTIKSQIITCVKKVDFLTVSTGVTAFEGFLCF